MDFIDKYNDLVSIVELNEEDYTNSLTVCIVTYYNDVIYHVNKLLETFKIRQYDGKCSINNNVFTIELTCDILHKIKFITPYSINEGYLKGFDNYYLINMCNYESEFDERFLIY